MSENKTSEGSEMSIKDLAEFMQIMAQRLHDDNAELRQQMSEINVRVRTVETRVEEVALARSKPTTPQRRLSGADNNNVDYNAIFNTPSVQDRVRNIEEKEESKIELES